MNKIKHFKARKRRCGLYEDRLRQFRIAADQVLAQCRFDDHFLCLFTITSEKNTQWLIGYNTFISTIHITV